MGQKRKSKWKCLFLHAACLLSLLLTVGCATTLELKKNWKVQKHLDTAENLMRKGDYEKALKENEEVVRLFPAVSPGDKALLRMGLIWAHPGNPQRNYKKALEFFQRFPHDFPNSSLEEDAKVWSHVIKELLSRESKIRDTEEKLSDLKKKLNELKEIDIRIEEKKREEYPVK